MPKKGGYGHYLDVKSTASLLRISACPLGTIGKRSVVVCFDVGWKWVVGCLRYASHHIAFVLFSSAPFHVERPSAMASFEASESCGIKGSGILNPFTIFLLIVRHLLFI